MTIQSGGDERNSLRRPDAAIAGDDAGGQLAVSLITAPENRPA